MNHETHKMCCAPESRPLRRRWLRPAVTALACWDPLAVVLICQLLIWAGTGASPSSVKSLNSTIHDCVELFVYVSPNLKFLSMNVTWAELQLKVSKVSPITRSNVPIQLRLNRFHHRRLTGVIVLEQWWMELEQWFSFTHTVPNYVYCKAKLLHTCWSILCCVDR
jgi:hypothetical protein